MLIIKVHKTNINTGFQWEPARYTKGPGFYALPDGCVMYLDSSGVLTYVQNGGMYVEEFIEPTLESSVTPLNDILKVIAVTQRPELINSLTNKE